MGLNRFHVEGDFLPDQVVKVWFVRYRLQHIGKVTCCSSPIGPPACRRRAEPKLIAIAELRSTLSRNTGAAHFGEHSYWGSIDQDQDQSVASSIKTMTASLAVTNGDGSP